MSKHSPKERMFQVLDYLAAQCKQHGVAPTSSMVQRKFGWKSRTSVVQIMRQLERELLIRRIEGTKLRYEYILDSTARRGVVKVPYRRIPKGHQFSERLPIKAEYWIERRLFALNWRVTPFLVAFDEPPRNPLVSQKSQMLLLMPWKPSHGARTWVMATVGGVTSVYWCARGEKITYLQKHRGKGADHHEISEDLATIHGRVVALLFRAPLA